jgi:valyl-tRNA synthetase
MKELPKAYNPKDVEKEILNFWLEKKLYHAEIDNSKKPFVIVIPPPNITGALHMGHALNNTLQDVIRVAKMKGFNALWVPGTDHGGIATQNVVERLLLKQGKTKHDLGREKFLEFMWTWRKETGDTILHQLKYLGCLCDWERTRFTMDEVCSKAVYKAFKTLFEQGYIYRGERIVNWCPRCQTALADIEVEYKEEKSYLWYIKYPFKNKEGSITVATVRPETMLGDTAVAVNPKDERYKNLIGEEVVLPLMNRVIKIIADDVVEPEFGTGAVKVTPAHDPADFDIAQRHNLEVIKVIDENGKMINVGIYSGLDRFECRKKVVEDLKQQGLLEKIEDYTHNVGICYRCGTVIEPLTSKQWFVRMKEIAKKAYNAISEGKVVYYPEVYKEYTLNWLENIKDWCISRQIWWGHRIPIWYCENETCKPIVSDTKPDKCPQCGAKNLIQDNDVLDTWFSSALWPFSVFSWGVDENNPELKYFYPTQILVTGYEILYLWVARMIMMGLHFLNEVPFREVYVHGIVRDIHGKKMSKSLGNVIDPLDIVEKYGTDALRFSLVSATTAGRDLHIAEESFVSSRNFMNKIYNMTRFIMLNIQEQDYENIKSWIKDFSSNFNEPNFGIAEHWILYELKNLVSNITELYKKYMLGNIANELYEFIWFKFCDWYLEVAKINLQDKNSKVYTLGLLIFVLEKILKLLHPITPFFTEYVYQNIKKLLPEEKESILETSFTTLDETKFEPYFEKVKFFELTKNMISEIRTIRNEFKLQNNLKPNIIIVVENHRVVETLKNFVSYIQRLAFVNEINLINKKEQEFQKPKYSSTAVFEITKEYGTAELYVLLEGMIDFDKEKERLKKEISELEKFISTLQQKLNNQQFLTKAPKSEVERTKELYQLNIEKINKLKKILTDIE